MDIFQLFITVSIVKIVFNEDQYEINKIQWECNENNTPVDIVIYANFDTIEDLARKHCLIGYNSEFVDEMEALQKQIPVNSWVALFGRLDPFTVIEYKKVTYR